MTLLSAKMSRLSGQSMMPFFAFSLGFRKRISPPSNVIWPYQTILSPPFICSFFFISAMMPDMVHMSVDFPALFEPKTPVIPPLRHSMLTLLTAIAFS